MSDSVTPGTVARQAPLSMEFSRQEYWSGLAIPFPRGLPNPGIEPGSPALQADSLPSEPPGKPWETGEEYERMDRRNQNLLKKNLFVSLLAVLGFHCFAWAFSGCSERGPCFIAGTGFSPLWPVCLQSTASRRAGFSGSRGAWA